jgi:hypothetical protein
MVMHDARANALMNNTSASPGAYALFNLECAACIRQYGEDRQHKHSIGTNNPEWPQ